MNPAELVRAFLAAMERRELAAARAFLADDFAMMFPGGARLTRLEDLVAHGGAFEGIRFIDRFAVRADKLADQKVWNDLGEHLRRHE